MPIFAIFCDFLVSALALIPPRLGQTFPKQLRLFSLGMREGGVHACAALVRKEQEGGTGRGRHEDQEPEGGGREVAGGA